MAKKLTITVPGVSDIKKGASQARKSIVQTADDCVPPIVKKSGRGLLRGLGNLGSRIGKGAKAFAKG